MSAWARWARDLGLDAGKVCELVHGRRSADTVALLLEEESRPEALARIDRYEMEDAGTIKAVKGASRLLAKMPRGQWAVVTSGRAELASARLAAARLPTAAVLVSADDVTAGKPDPEGYLMAAERLGVPAVETVVLEDAPAGIDAARAAGVAAVIGVGDRAGARADLVIADLSCLRWANKGLEVVSPQIL